MNSKSAKHYDPFGMLTSGRNWTAGSGEEYRFRLNGKESDAETYGSGNIYDYGYRIYNPRLGKFLSVDPLTGSYPFLLPYQFAEDSPISGIDRDSLVFTTIIRDLALNSDCTLSVGCEGSTENSIS